MAICKTTMWEHVGLARGVRVWLVTGDPGVGKTTVLLEVVRRMRAKGYSVGGVVSKEVRAGMERTGFELEDLASGVKGALASVRLPTGPKIGRYRVSLHGLADVAAKALGNARLSSDLIVCDEVGPMELFSSDFRRAVEALVGSNKPMLFVVHKRMKDPLIQRLKALPYSELLDVTIENRSKLPDELADRILDLFVSSRER